MDTLPCNACNAACCRQFGNAKFAVALHEEEEKDFPEAKTYKGSFGKVKGFPFKDGKCIHLNDENRCDIYEKRPMQCREFNCLNAYFLYGDTHGKIIQHNPNLVPLIQLHAPDFVEQREAERPARRKATRT